MVQYTATVTFGDRTYTDTTENITLTGTALDHDYDSVVTAPSCTEGGFTTYTCTRCGDSYKADVTAALGHSFTNYVSNNDATCTKDGTKTAKCDRCDATDRIADEGSATGHAYGDPVWTWAKDFSSATAKFTCAKNDDAQTKAATITTNTVSNADCTADRVVQYTATVTFGDRNYSDTTENITLTGTTLDHDYDSVVTAPTCTEKGYTTYICTRCGDSYKADVTAALGHYYVVEIEKIAPTCGSAGYTVYKCSRCSKTESRDTIPETGAHTWGTWIVTTQPTDNTNGEEQRTCSVCETQETRKLYRQSSAYGVRIEYPEGSLDDEHPPHLVVESLTGASFSQYTQFLQDFKTESTISAYKISLQKDGEDVQPAGPVTVWFPVPNGFAISIDHVIAHVNNNPYPDYYYHPDYKKMSNLRRYRLDEAKQYFVFDVTSFSPFILYEITDTPTLTIRNNSGAAVLRYGETLTLTADVENLPDGARLVWEADSDRVILKPSADGKTCEVTSKKNGTAVISVKIVGADGQALERDDEEIAAWEVIQSKASFRYKLFWFFKRLFGVRMHTVQTYRKK